MKIEKKRGKDTFICIFMLEYRNRKYGEKHQRKEGEHMDWKKIRRAICGAAAVVAVCFTAAGMNTKPVYAADMGAVYGIFEHGVGWSAYHGDQTAERAGNGTYVTAIRASLSGQPEGMSGTLSYQVNLSGSGWLSWQENMAETGTIETGMPLEAIRMELTGQLKDYYDVYYSVFQNGSWTAPVKNGETAGTEGQGLRVDGIWVTVTEKDAAAPEGPKNGGIDPTRPMVALTFDDGPSKYTERILNSLEANGGRATFFMVGNRVASYASTVKRMADLGCETNSHTWAHTYLTNMSEGQILQSLNQTRDAIVAAGGNAPKGVRPPGGKINDASKAVLAKAGMPSIVWSVDTLDWKTRNAQKTIDTVLSQVKDGDIVLMHDLYEQSAIAAETLIPELTKRGYQLVTVSEMAELRGGMAAGHSYGHFR